MSINSKSKRSKRRTRAMIEKTCEECGKKYKTYNYREKTSKYCSAKCYHKSTRKNTTETCINCGKIFKKRYANAPQKLCSSKCTYEYKRNGTRKVTVGKDGYKYIWFYDGTSKKEHIYIIENLIGRKLKKGECVHHIDGNRANNEISNLKLMTLSEHSSLHRKLELKQGKKLFGRK